ncbi:MAG TPA: helix-turn-helix domain-containing protein [Vicinamibacterales bacterium]|jgi:cytoskeletal protein RodZ|nr:helix-turn-helix domain-containing protein [Vicinamibacterales bacterium]
MTEQEAFVTRLRRRRERNRIPLKDIAQETRVKLELLQELERNDLSNWPRGLYARAYIRAYAAAIGLDGNDAVDEFCRLFPQGDRRTEPVIREMAVIVASQTEYRYDYRYATEVDRRRSADVDMLPKTRTETAMAAVGRAGRAVMSLVGALGSRSQTASPRS